MADETPQREGLAAVEAAADAEVLPRDASRMSIRDHIPDPEGLPDEPAVGFTSISLETSPKDSDASMRTR